jgi:hypothetical protein
MTATTAPSPCPCTVLPQHDSTTLPATTPACAAAPCATSTMGSPSCVVCRMMPSPACVRWICTLYVAAAPPAPAGCAPPAAPPAAPLRSTTAPQHRHQHQAWARQTACVCNSPTTHDIGGMRAEPRQDKRGIANYLLKQLAQRRLALLDQLHEVLVGLRKGAVRLLQRPACQPQRDRAHTAKLSHCAHKYPLLSHDARLRTLPSSASWPRRPLHEWA